MGRIAPESVEPRTSGPGGGAAGYLFIDNARFISMIAILMRHCELALFGPGQTPLIESGIIQFRTFGVQIFFVNSAFLMAEWLLRNGGETAAYWKSRLRYVGLPWVLWVLVYIALDLAKAMARHDNLASMWRQEVINTVFFQSYWFVPVLFFSLALLLPMRRYWDSTWLGVVLLIPSLFYGVNQYTCWVPTSHTTAFFGYLFPLWFGIRLFRRFNSITEIVNGIPVWVLTTVTTLAFVSTILEDRVMERLGFPDYYNALQITNQIYSVIVLLVLIRIRVRMFPSIIDVRKETYGIYLTHQIVASFGTSILHLATHGSEYFKSISNTWTRIGIWFAWSTIVYLISVVVTKWLRRMGLGWTVGVKERLKAEG